MQLLRHLVVGTDFSPCAESALTAAITIANLGRARITLVHVCELSTELGLPERMATTAVDAELLHACEQRLATEVARFKGRGIELASLLRSGKPWEKLNNAAIDVGANLIVIGRHGHGGGAFGLGGVANHVLHTASRPVLVVGPSEVSP
jgi:nucleotide-binding universal stress UspA family protein